MCIGRLEDKDGKDRDRERRETYRFRAGLQNTFRSAFSMPLKTGTWSPGSVSTMETLKSC